MQFETHPDIPFKIPTRDWAETINIGFGWESSNIGLEQLEDGRWIWWKKWTPLFDAKKHPKKQYVILNEEHGELAHRIFLTIRVRTEDRILLSILFLSLILLSVGYTHTAHWLFVISFSGLALLTCQHMAHAERFVKKHGITISGEEMTDQVDFQNISSSVPFLRRAFNWIVTPIVLLIIVGPLFL